jgi:hypothetical protein
MGLEPTTSDLEGQRSTTELFPHFFKLGTIITQFFTLSTYL